MKPLNKLFDVEYGNQFDLNKMEILNVWNNESVNFISRASKNLGVSAIVKRLPNIKPYESGLITVALGGSILSSFVQQKPFYTAQNIMVLKPKKIMSFEEKAFYCLCIKKNVFRYSAFGREANRTLKTLEVPDSIPDWIYLLDLTNIENVSLSVNDKKIDLKSKKWKCFTYEELFYIKKGKRITNKQMKKGKIPCIRPIESNNGVYKFIDITPNHKENTITVSYNGSIGESFYQPEPYFALDDINVLYPRDFKLNPFISMFLITLIRKEKYRFNYGRKWHVERMYKSKIKLPIKDKDETPDWNFMENYIKSLPYSINLK